MYWPKLSKLCDTRHCLWLLSTAFFEKARAFLITYIISA
jgi:hypothetical protein